jgi:TM2 domain-containing membrane protein YozV
MGLIQNKEQLRTEENQLREQIAVLSVEQKRQYYAQELQHIKDPDTYAALNWAFVAGLHHFYLGKWQRGLINLTLMLVGLFLYIIGPFTLVGAALILFVFIIELPQLFYSQNVIHRYNNQLMKRILKQFDHHS